MTAILLSINARAVVNYMSGKPHHVSEFQHSPVHCWLDGDGISSSVTAVGKRPREMGYCESSCCATNIFVLIIF